MCDACDAGVNDDPVNLAQWQEQQRSRFREVVDTKGWAIQHVEGGTDTPSFSYTVGLWGHRHPEVVVWGLDPCCAGGFLDHVGWWVRSGGCVLHDGDEIDFRGTPARMFALPNPGEVIFTANDLYGRAPWESLPALQAVYPDRDGTWPWEPGCRLPPGSQPMPGSFRA